MAQGPAPRVVLDTNVCLDLFLFGDPRCTALGAALAAGAVVAVCREDTRAEWQAVLDYPGVPADPARRTLARQRFDRCVRWLDPAPAPPPRLPRCADPDDQKFVELAVQSGARWLLSRDRALLALDRRLQRAHGCAVREPGDWRYAPPPSSANPV